MNRKREDVYTAGEEGEKKETHSFLPLDGKKIKGKGVKAYMNNEGEGMQMNGKGEECK